MSSDIDGMGWYFEYAENKRAFSQMTHHGRADWRTKSRLHLYPVDNKESSGAFFQPGNDRFKSSFFQNKSTRSLSGEAESVTFFYYLIIFEQTTK